MFAKIFLIACLATLVVSFPKDDHDNDLLPTLLSSATNVGREFSKFVADDADKYSVDLNSLYKKYEIASKAEQAKSFLQSQYKRGAEIANEYIKKADVETEDQLKKSIEIIKKEDSVLGEKLNKFYEKTCEVDRISEDIIKYTLDSERVNSVLEKVRSALHPLEHKVADAIKKIEAVILDQLQSKKGKGKN